MKNDNRFLTALLIVIPVVALGIISIGPYPIEMVSIWQKARLAAAQQKYTLAADLYKQLVIYQPERTDLWNTIGDLEFQGENYTDAVTAYQKAEQANVITEKGLFNLGFSFQEEEQSQLALNAWRRLIGWPGLESGQYSHLVEILRGEGDFESALQAAKAWNDHYPHDEQAAYNYGILLKQRMQKF
jgi:tetratricopeptide (TPR) repeat protein